MKIFDRKEPLKDSKKSYIIPEQYHRLSDVYTESPFGHHENASDADKEEYFMQWVNPIKLNRLALRTAAGFRLIYQYAKDLWNNRIAIKVPNEEEKTEKINQQLFEHLINLNWFQEMEKLSAFKEEQGEAILLCYYDDEGGIENYKNPIDQNKPILKVEAFSPLRYNIPEFDKYGKPKKYLIEVKATNSWRFIRTVEIHPSRVLRECSENIEHRFTGYSSLAAVADPITILSTILKACGEAAFRWGTGHPIFLTKEIDAADLEKLKTALGEVNRRSWHCLPSEKIEEIFILGEAGGMLNLQALADICIQQIVIGSGIPQPILLGEVAGVMGSEVSERGYFARLDRDHSDLEYFVRAYFKKDVNIRRILRGVKYYELDWGIREVFNKNDQAEYDQKMASIAIAMMQYATVNEARKFANLPPISEEDGGEIILGLLPYYELQLNMAMMAMQAEEEEETHSEAEGRTAMKEKSHSTNKQAASIKEPEKNKRVAPPTRDAKQLIHDNLINLQKKSSVKALCKEMGISDKTFYKLIEWTQN